MRKELYLAYGSNLNVKQMRERCPESKKIGSAIVENYKLNFRGTRRGSGFANIERCKGSTVPVGIWQISRYDEMELDFYEGYPNLYMKTYLPFMYKGKMYEGLAYVMRPGHPVLEPAEWYENRIREGYRNFGIDTEALDKALDDCKESMKQDESWRDYLLVSNNLYGYSLQ